MRHPYPYSIIMLEQMSNSAYPLMDRNFDEEIGRALENARKDQTLTLEQMEELLLYFGKKIWPYARAFGEYRNCIEQQRGLEFFEAHLRDCGGLEMKAGESEESGVSLREIFAGARSVMDNLSIEERVALGRVIRAVNMDIERATVAWCAGVGRRQYERRVVEFTILQEEVQEQCEAMAVLAKDIGHAQLADEIAERIRRFHGGVSLLHASAHPDAARQARQGIFGRHAELTGNA